MAITLTKEPSGLYPAYNDAYMEFTSNATGDYKVEISVEGITGQTFTVYPNASGVYLFNLKNAVRYLINSNTFKDQDTAYPLGWNVSYPYGYLDIDVTTTEYGTGGAEAPEVNNYTFIRGVKQVGESVHSNPYQLLHPSTNGVDYSLTYFEGFPFSFEIMRPILSDSLIIRNLNSSDVTGAIVVDATGTHRIYIDKSTVNWTTAAYLPLTDTLNRLELEFNLVVETNLNIKKKEVDCGVYLKWYNNDGGYSYWLFDEFWKETLRGRNRGFVSDTSFNNVGSTVSSINSIGKDATKAMGLKTKVDRTEAKHLESLFMSPSVQMWSKTEGFQDGEWIDVVLTGDYSLSTKRSINEVSLSIELPELITAKL